MRDASPLMIGLALYTSNSMLVTIDIDCFFLQGVKIGIERAHRVRSLFHKLGYGTEESSCGFRSSEEIGLLLMFVKLCT
jgi:hypothetical protein